MVALKTSAPATDEDLVAWDHCIMRMLGGRRRKRDLLLYAGIYWDSLLADRLDAASMSEREVMKAETAENHGGWRTHRREWFPSQWGSELDGDWGWHNPSTLAE